MGQEARPAGVDPLGNALGRVYRRALERAREAQEREKEREKERATGAPEERRPAVVKEGGDGNRTGSA